MTINRFASRTKIIAAIVAFSQPCLAQQHFLDSFPLTRDTMLQWKLPDRLKEISGLALSPDGRLFAVADEIAAVYELDYQKGEIIKRFAYGEPVVRGDFEGITFYNDKIWLTTSSGEIYSGSEGADREQLPYQRYQSGLDATCEIEGLTAQAATASLLLLCKKLWKGSELDRLAIFRWSVSNKRLDRDATILLPEEAIFRQLKVDRFNPSGIAIPPHGESFVIVASRQRALVEVSLDGQLLVARKLKGKNRHRQAEGIEITEDARLLIADEGGSHKARLAVYSKQGAEEKND
jgi:uncharacterized protein YjiK